MQCTISAEFTEATAVFLEMGNYHFQLCKNLHFSNKYTAKTPARTEFYQIRTRCVKSVKDVRNV